MNWNDIISSATPIDEIHECFKIDMEIDSEKLVSSFYELFTRLGHNYDKFIKHEAEYAKIYGEDNLENGLAVSWDMNLNHPLELTGDDRWRKYRGHTSFLIEAGGDISNFSEILSELTDLYLGDVIKKIFAYHKQTTGRDFVGIAKIIWLGAGRGYDFHTDEPKTLMRYHVPIITNNDVTWVFNEQPYKTLHMPLGSVWKFFPLAIEHSVRNNSQVDRAHLVISECTK